MQENIHQVQLENGLRVVMEPVPTVQSVAVGIWVASGSRYETQVQRGMAHFLEHMLFKGTPTRSATQIAEEIEGRGGMLNAGTGKEVTCYYARVLAEHTPIALDVLFDIFLNSVFDPFELEREKGVVLEEMKMYEDSPGDIIHDLFSEAHWQDHPLGRRVIGVPETVSAFTRDMLVEFVQTHYVPDRVVVAAAGNLDPDAFLQEVETRIGKWQPQIRHAAGTPANVSGQANAAPVYERDVEQVHFCIGTDALSQYDERRYALFVMNSLLGGSMFSRLWQEVREKRGLAYDIGSYPSLFTDRGTFVVYGGTAEEVFEEVQSVVHQEFERLKAEPISKRELDSARNQLKGTRLLALESMQARMERLGAETLVYNKITPVEELLRNIEAVQATDIQLLANDLLQPERLTLTAIVPEKE